MEQRITDLLPAPVSSGTRTVTDNFLINPTGYSAFADANATAPIRKDYLVSYIAAQIAFQRQYVYPYNIGTRVTGGIEVNNQQNNNASGRYSLVAAGSSNATGGAYALISEGSNNTASGDYSVILNGSGSAIPVGADRAFIGTGQFHTLGATASDSAILVGQGHTINSPNSLITNGTYSTIQAKCSYIGVINSNSVTVNSGSTYVTAINCNGLSVPAGTTNKTYINGREIQVPSATPAAIKTAVTNPANTWLNGELQGTQPANSQPGMKFCDAQYRYEYANGMDDTNGTTYVWISIGKYHG